MSTNTKASADWDRIYSAIRARSRVSVSVGRRAIPHPRDAGARPTASWPVGQIADYAINAQPGAVPLSVREFNDHFEAFVDTIELSNRVVDAVEANPRAATLLGGALLGGAIGSSMTNKREGAMIGAGLGLLLAATIHASPRKGRRR